MSDNIKLLKNYLLYFLSMILVCIVGISNVFADEFVPSSALQYYEYYTSSFDTKYERGVTFGQNIELSSPNTINYPYAISLILYGNFKKDYNYVVTTNVSSYFETQYFKFYYPDLNYLIINAYVSNNGGADKVLCNIQPVTENSAYTITCTYKPTSNIDHIVIGLINKDVQHNGYVPFGAGDYVKFANYNVQQYDNSGEVIIDQNNTIINQNNQNTQNIIDNQNSNTQQQIESQKVCNKKLYDKFTIKKDNYYLNSTGLENYSSDNGISDYIQIDNNTVITLLNGRSGGAYSCFYNENKELISCFAPLTSLEGVISIPSNSKFFRITYNKSQNLPIYEISSCLNGNQALNDSITGLNDSLNDADTDGATSEASDFFSSFTTNTFGLTSIITAPLNLIQSLSSSSCSELHLPLPYLNNKYLDLPCMTTIYQTHFGAFFTMYQTITYGIIAYWVCVRIFNQIKDFKNPEHDEIEVVDL